MFGRDHYLPEQVRQMAEESVDVENYEAMLDLVVHRSAILRDSMPKAFERALQAQFRDVERYKKSGVAMLRRAVTDLKWAIMCM